jgi:hypothetical protein
MRWSLILALMMFPALIAPGLAATTVGTATQNLTEHSWMYFQGYMDDTRIYQTDPGYAGQKLVSGTRGSGTVSRTQSAQVYGGGDYDEISFNEWGVFDYKPYTPPPTQSDLKNALCAKNYEVGSVFSESYSNIQQLVKDTNVYQDDQVSVYQIGSIARATTKIGSRVQKNANTVPAYTMGGTYVGDLNIRMEIETGNSSILTLPCP